MAKPHGRVDHQHAPPDDDRERGDEQHRRPGDRALLAHADVFLAEHPVQERAPANRQPVDAARAECEHDHVGDQHYRDDRDRHGRRQPADDQRRRRDQDGHAGEALDCKRLASDANEACHQSTDADHRREVEDIRPDDDPYPGAVLSLEQRRDRRRKLRRVSGDRGQQAQKRLGKAKP